jgi:protein tyrosine/serine phosphatase
MTISTHIFFRLLAHAPEELQRQAKDDARRTIPALCFTEDDIRRTLVQEEGWEDLTDEEQVESIEMLLDASYYDPVAAAANQAIAEAAVYYLTDVLMEKAEQQEGGGDELQ